jgi:hypothetical protein
MIHKQERQANIISLLIKCRKAGELKQATHICFLYELKVAFSQQVDSKVKLDIQLVWSLSSWKLPGAIILSIDA